jgi:hypothetical protein
MLNPLTAEFTPGMLARYHGSILAAHGTVRVDPCHCPRCHDPLAGTVRFRLTDPATGRQVATCVRGHSLTAST